MLFFGCIINVVGVMVVAFVVVVGVSGEAGRDGDSEVEEEATMAE